MGNDRHDIFGNIGPGVAIDVLHDMRVIEDLLLLRQLKRTSIGQVGKVDPQVEGFTRGRFCDAESQGGEGGNESRDPKC
jgi:hypothetical protein